MPKKLALLVGINTYHRTIGPLKGCLADVLSVRAMLTERFAFPEDGIISLQNEDATRPAILEGLNWIAKDATTGDILVFFYSGHGTFISNIADPSGRDEVLVAFSPEWDVLLANELSCSAIFRPENWGLQFIRDKEIKSVFDGLMPDVNVTLIMDCCHSGDINRKTDIWPRFIQPPPEVVEQVNQFYSANQQRLQAEQLTSQDLWDANKLNPTQFAQKILRGNRFDYVDTEETSILLAACSPSEKAAERQFGDIRRGVFSYHLTNILSSHDGELSYRDLIDQVARRMLMETQRPRLSCRQDLQGRTFLATLQS